MCSAVSDCIEGYRHRHLGVIERIEFERKVCGCGSSVCRQREHRDEPEPEPAPKHKRY